MRRGCYGLASLQSVLRCFWWGQIVCVEVEGKKESERLGLKFMPRGDRAHHGNIRKPDSLLIALPNSALTMAIHSLCLSLLEHRRDWTLVFFTFSLKNWPKCKPRKFSTFRVYRFQQLSEALSMCSLSPSCAVQQISPPKCLSKGCIYLVSKFFTTAPPIYNINIPPRLAQG